MVAVGPPRGASAQRRRHGLSPPKRPKPYLTLALDRSLDVGVLLASESIPQSDTREGRRGRDVSHNLTSQECRGRLHNHRCHRERPAPCRIRRNYSRDVAARNMCCLRSHDRVMKKQQMMRYPYILIKKIGCLFFLNVRTIAPRAEAILNAGREMIR